MIGGGGGGHGVVVTLAHFPLPLAPPFFFRPSFLYLVVLISKFFPFAHLVCLCCCY